MSGYDAWATDAYWADVQAHETRAEKAEAERDALRSEVERLRAALTAESERSTIFLGIAADNGHRYDEAVVQRDEALATVARAEALADRWQYEEMPDPATAGRELSEELRGDSS